ncbi:MAG: alpha/beta hydrolase [Acidobacteria bacterium]|nr:alpha/beta hydrolase [Acidobacteriota bacterium]
MFRPLLLVALFSLAATDVAAVLQTRESVVLDDHRVGYVERGDGVTVVFEAGLGDTVETWSSLFDDVARFSHAFAYDRPGYGNSGRAFSPRDGAHIVVELHELLRAANAKPPYVMVGHSFGGMFAELFARTYPDEIAALVLIESRPGEFTRRCRQARAPSCDVPAWMASFMPPAARAELEAIDDTQRALAAAPPLREDLPLWVISAGRHYTEGVKWSQLWDAMQEEMASRSTNGHHIVSERSGHYVQRDARRVVIDAIREAVKAVRPTQ